MLNYLNQCRRSGEEIDTANVAASFQKAAVDILCERVDLGLDELGDKIFALAGGVAANRHLRAGLEEVCKKHDVKFYCPEPVYCTDNAAMIGAAAYYEYMAGVRHGLDLNAIPSLKLGERI